MSYLWKETWYKVALHFLIALSKLVNLPCCKHNCMCSSKMSEINCILSLATRGAIADSFVVFCGHFQVNHCDDKAKV